VGGPHRSQWRVASSEWNQPTFCRSGCSAWGVVWVPLRSWLAELRCAQLETANEPSTPAFSRRNRECHPRCGGGLKADAETT